MALHPDVDVQDVYRRLTQPQARISKQPGQTNSNRTKRIRLRLRVPGYEPADAAKLADLLARGLSGPDARDLLAPFAGEKLQAIDGSLDIATRLTPDAIWVAPSDGLDEHPVLFSAIQPVLDQVYGQGSIAAGDLPDEFVGTVLKELPDIDFDARTGRFTKRTAGPVDKDFAVFDRKATVKYRVEQDALRKLLVGPGETASCDLCGEDLPVRFLVAAHIKQRSQCTDQERGDLKNVAMLACLLGCDKAFELGIVTVDTGGRVRVAKSDGMTGKLAQHLDYLSGRTCTAHGPDSETYFKWHRERWA